MIIWGKWVANNFGKFRKEQLINYIAIYIEILRDIKY